MTDYKYPYGYAGDPQGMGTMLTWSQMVTKKTVYMLHPEVQRRFHALIEFGASKGVPLGVGTGWRIQPTNADGSAKPGFASPGNSWHESCPVNPESPTAFAIDTVPNISWDWMESNCGKYGFRTFRYVDNEPWHIQPVEISTSRKYATVPPGLPVWNLPTTPTTPVGEDDMPLSQEDIDKIAKAVWAIKVSVPNKEPQGASWVLGQTYQLGQRAVKASEEAAANTRP